MFHSSSGHRTDTFNWASNLFLVGVLEQHGSRWAVFSVALSLVLALPSVDGKTHRTDLPDNGFRFLPPDVEKVIPSSVPLLFDRASEVEGNPSALTNSFIAFSTVLPIMAVLLAVLSWKRRRKDRELYESVLQTYHTRKELLNRAERLNVDVYEKNTQHQQWTSIQFPPQTESGPELRDSKRGNENQSSKNERDARPMQPPNATVASQCPEVAVSIPPLPQDMLETTIAAERILPLPTGSDPPGSALQSGKRTSSENSSPQDKPNLPDHEIEDFPIPTNRKTRVDSIIVYCEKQKKLSRES
ncbi:hypothetical protein PGT21_003146 [Puccinia graminis f. sp. tritici]|uniref:Uncharacterized protein n=1 Tax=Puccinia graminis f. sp. tritici TaxID=56615 RepID=A0A5B0MKA2_PUCGR|nr:hypothetical protein PGT21_003146 [Puccinia graminis f. sp. tritici]KAA1137427.1 hypothetical protein PGTUg99_012562 [Puccinia graminis f. sp. tritici]